MEENIRPRKQPKLTEYIEEMEQIDPMERRVPETPKVPSTPRVPKKNSTPQTPQVEGPPRVTEPKAPPMVPRIKPQGVTPGSTSKEIDLDTNKQVMTENQRATTGKVSLEVDRAETKTVLSGNQPKITHGNNVVDGVEATIKDTRAVTTRALSHLDRVRMAGRVGALLFGAGVFADISNKLAADRKEKRQVAKQEDDLRKKERIDRKDTHKMFGYDYMDYGNVVQEMWNNRTGHYKMGNSKFK